MGHACHPVNYKTPAAQFAFNTLARLSPVSHGVCNVVNRVVVIVASVLFFGESPLSHLSYGLVARTCMHEGRCQGLMAAATAGVGHTQVPVMLSPRTPQPIPAPNLLPAQAMSSR